MLGDLLLRLAGVTERFLHDLPRGGIATAAFADVLERALVILEQAEVATHHDLVRPRLIPELRERAAVERDERERLGQEAVALADGKRHERARFAARASAVAHPSDD